MGLEKRQHRRFLVKDNAVVALENGETRVGGFRDISEGGSAFEYISDETLPMYGQVKSHIFLSGDKFRLSEIPCNIIYDKLINRPAGRTVFVPYVTKRCGVQFGNLTKEQHAQLLYFIDTFNTGFVTQI